MKIIVLGAGAWGTALAISAAKNAHSVQLIARNAQAAHTLQAERCNIRYLPGQAFPELLRIEHGDAQSLALSLQKSTEPSKPDLIIIATPMVGLESSLAHLIGLQIPLAWLCKGFDANGRLGHEICAGAAPENIAPWGILSGPSFALEVARGQPTALVAASDSAALRSLLQQAFHSERLRVYASADVIGVEVGGAVKNVMAIATGLCDGLQLGLNARAALITRGLAEMTRLGTALGAKPETFMGLSGLGDLVLTATGDLSRNRQVGLYLARGLSAQEATARLGHVAEGVRCAQAVAERAEKLGVLMPITQAVVALLQGKTTAEQAVQSLMSRGAGEE